MQGLKKLSSLLELFKILFFFSFFFYSDEEQVIPGGYVNRPPPRPTEGIIPRLLNTCQD